MRLVHSVQQRAFSMRYTITANYDPGRRTVVMLPSEKLPDDVLSVARWLYHWTGGKGFFQVCPGKEV